MNTIKQYLNFTNGVGLFVFIMGLWFHVCFEISGGYATVAGVVFVLAVLLSGLAAIIWGTYQRCKLLE